MSAEDHIFNLFRLNLSNCEDSDSESKNENFIENILPWLMQENRWKHIIVCQPSGFNRGSAKFQFFHNLSNLIEISKFPEDEVVLKLAIGTAVAFESDVIALPNQYPHANDR